MAWDDDFLAMDGDPVIRFGNDGLGEFHFGAVYASIDYRVEEDKRGFVAEFSWEGFDDGSQVSGRGWAVWTDGQLRGQIFVHNGDESPFVATMT
jgi:hypothetical protein